MDEPAPKRRRTSGEEAAEVSDAINRSPTRNRPSFASPTKSSLSRYNPQILERRRSSSPSKTPASRIPTRRVNNNDPPVRVSASQEPEPEPVEDVPASDSQTEPGPDRRLRSASRSSSSGSKPPRRARGSLGAMPRRPPRPLPPPAPEGEDELDPFLGRVLRRSPTTGVNIPRNTEPELPPSSSDAVSSTPPRGIHSSPLKWKEKTKQKKPSPLKAAMSRDTSPMKIAPPRFSLPARRLGSLAPAQEILDPSLNPECDAARHVPAFDANAAKKKEIEAARLQLETLRKDVEVAERENERIRVMQSRGRNIGPPNGDEILALLWRHLIMPPEKSLPPLQSQMLVRSALNASGLLPFSKPAAVTRPAQMGNIKSHHPVALTASEEKPYLQLFSPFDATSTVAVLPSILNQGIRQRHSITLRHRDAPGLFTARVDLVVDASDLTILQIDIKALEPAARAELGPFLERICSGDCNRSMQRNVGIVAWAMGEWVRVATQRARTWIQLDRSLGKAGLAETAARLRAKSRGRRARDEDEEDEVVETCEMKDILRRLDQQWYEVPLPDEASSRVRLEWKAAFDWSGEAQSTLSLKVGLAGKWHAADKSSALGRAPQLFQDLVQGGQEPSTALESIVVLLSGGLS